MTTFIAYPSRNRLIIGFVLVAVFFASSLWMIGVFGEIPTNLQYSEERVVFVGYLGIISSLFAIFYTVSKIFSRRFLVSISPEGIVASDWGNNLIPWSEIDEITEYTIYGNNMLVMSIKNRKYINKSLSVIFSSIYRKIYGFDICLNFSYSDRTQKEAMDAIYFFRPASDTV